MRRAYNGVDAEDDGDEAEGGGGEAEEGGGGDRHGWLVVRWVFGGVGLGVRWWWVMRRGRLIVKLDRLGC